MLNVYTLNKVRCDRIIHVVCARATLECSLFSFSCLTYSIPFSTIAIPHPLSFSISGEILELDMVM
jgi:hypothetical protein